MKRPLLLLCIVAVSVLSSAENQKGTRPAASMSPSSDFSPEPGPTTPTPKPKPTTTTQETKPTTTTPKPKPTTTTQEPKPTTTTPKPKPTTTTPEPKPTTTTPKPKPTTTTPKPKPTTTTPKPKPTTTTPKPKPTTTTPKPKPTTTTPKPTVPPKPTPPANLTVGNYNVTTDKGLVCLMAQMAVRIRLVSSKMNGTFIVQPLLTNASGKCEAAKAYLNLTFKEGFITFMFNKNVTEKVVYVDTLSFTLTYPFSSGGNADDNKHTAKNESMHLFAAKLGHSYSCKNESLYMGNGLYLDVTQDQMQAFDLPQNKFGSADVCPADQPDYRVAIAVGVTLLVLIAIVIVCFLLGRRRRADGYQSL